MHDVVQNTGVSFVGFNAQALERMKDLVRQSEDSDVVSWNLLDVPTCRRAWKSLHHMGASF